MIHYAVFTGDAPDASLDLAQVTCPECLLNAEANGLMSRFDFLERMVKASATMVVPKTREQYKFDVLQAAVAGAKEIGILPTGTFRLHGVPANIKALFR